MAEESAGKDLSLKPAGEHGLSVKAGENPQHPGVSRRTFLSLLAGGLVAVAAKRFGLLDKGAEIAGKVLNTSDSNWRKPIEGDEEKRQLVTSLFGENKEVILRSDVTQDEGSIVGYTRAGLTVETQPVYGTVYPENSDYLSKLKKDGKEYGIWYRITVPVYNKTASGELIERLENGKQINQTVYVSGNYLEMPKIGNSPAGK